MSPKDKATSDHYGAPWRADELEKLLAAEREAHDKTRAHVSHLEHLMVGEGYTSEHAAHAVARLVAERDAALAKVAELEKQVQDLEDDNIGAALVDEETCNQLATALKEARDRIAELEKELATQREQRSGEFALFDRATKAEAKVKTLREAVVKMTAMLELHADPTCCDGDEHHEEKCPVGRAPVFGGRAALAAAAKEQE